jgi:hypothetical protein
MSDANLLRNRAKALQLHGLLAHWSETAGDPWPAMLIDWEEQERTRRSPRLRTKGLLTSRCSLISSILPRWMAWNCCIPRRNVMGPGGL